jgi:nucleotide-binding universal stress UspA family protein
MEVMFVVRNSKIVLTKMNDAILCTIDLSDSSRDVLKYAIDLSKERKNHITVLYAYRLISDFNGETVEMKKRIEDNAKHQFAILEKEILAKTGVSYDFKVEVGFVSNRVREYARKNGVSFLVMGKKMNTSSKESFDELAENLHVPLVIVP